MISKKETSATFVQNVLESELPVLVDFWAPWCGPCKQIGPVLDSIASDLDGKMNLSKVNVDEQPQLSETYGIRAIPTMILFHKGAEQARLVGSVPKADILRLLDKHLLSPSS